MRALEIAGCSPETKKMLDLFRRAFEAADFAAADFAAGRHVEEDQCVDLLKQLAMADFSREIMMKTDIGSRLGKLEGNHPSGSIQRASKAVLDAMVVSIYRVNKARDFSPKRPPISKKTAGLPTISKKTAIVPKSGLLPKKTAPKSGPRGENIFELFQRAFKAASSERPDEETRCIDGFKQIVKVELPEDLDLLSYMVMRVSKLEENHASLAVREASTAVLNAIRRRLDHMNAVRPVRRFQKINRAKPVQYAPMVQSY